MATEKKMTPRQLAELRETLKNSNPVDFAEMLEEFSESEAIVLFRMLPKDTAAEVFAYLERDMQHNIINAIKDKEMREIIDDLFLDDVVDFIEEMPAGVVKRVLSHLPKEKRDMINQFLQYPEDSAGSIMTIEYVELNEDLTVAETFERIRQDGVDKETIYTCYVIDKKRYLLGAISAKTLLLASPDEKIGNIMTRDVIFAETSDDVESLANDFRRYGLLAMPIVDHEKRLVGIVTVDDVLEVQEEEATEDFEIMAAISPSDDPYLKTSVWKLARNRLPWLMLMMLTATITGSIIEAFDSVWERISMLMMFVPMLMDTAGNSGSQSSTLIIRGMAIEEVTVNDVLKVLWKELRVAFICGATLSVVNFVRIIVMYYKTAVVNIWTLSFSVSLALFLTVIMAKSVGCLFPIMAKKLRFDPAVMASPMITTIVDALALLVLFVIVKIMFRI